MSTADTPQAGTLFLRARNFLLEHREDYPLAYEGFRWPELTQFNWALDYFDPMAGGNDALALWVVGESEVRLSFAQLSERSNRLANHLRGLGVQRGDRIMLMLPNHPVLWELMLAAMKLGAVILPASTQLSRGDVDERLDRARVGYVVALGPELDRFGDGDCVRLTLHAGAGSGWLSLEEGYQASPTFLPDGPTGADDPLFLYFTSGTTSRPKLVVHSHQSYPVGHLSTMYWLGLRPGDLHWNISSPGWAKHAWSSFFAPWNAGAAIFSHNYARFEARVTLETLASHPVTSLCAPPTVWRMLIQEDLSRYRVGLREAVGAGEPLNPEIIERVKSAWGLDLRDGYGQTETTCQIGNSPGQPLRPGSMGRPLPGYRVTLLGPDDRPCQSEGEIALERASAPLGLMSGYLDDPVTDHGPYYRTCDLAERGADGYLTSIGRTDDVFKSSDYRLSPFELESVLVEHPAVAEAAVVPSPDPIRLTVPKAFISLSQSASASPELACHIFDFCRERLAPFKRIRRLEFRDLPKTISGKIRRAELRRLEYARDAGDRRHPDEYWQEDFP